MDGNVPSGSADVGPHFNFVLEAQLARHQTSKLRVTIPLELTQSASSKKPNPSYLFQLYDPKLPTKFKFTDPDPFSYFGSVGNATCFSLGTDFNASRTTCVCRPGWFSDDCSLPEAISSSKRFRRRWTNKKIHRRAGPPRRLVNAINVNHELDLLEVRLRELYDVVDVFVICESNYSARGEPKPLHLLPKLREGFLAPYQNKIVHVFLDHFPKKGREDGWFADGYQRTFLWRQAKKQLSGLKDDDLLILTDADEIPRAGPLAYLKTHEGFSEPIVSEAALDVVRLFLAARARARASSVCVLDALPLASAGQRRIAPPSGGHPGQLRTAVRGGARGLDAGPERRRERRLALLVVLRRGGTPGETQVCAERRRRPLGGLPRKDFDPLSERSCATWSVVRRQESD
ncbi:hypothetical protein HPB48_001810 [Haemaphysalis longicornis]|uniref:EGF-like domain-containing protein n=1 Tax=Haemaphysalis longicornis TaxID=44386 RepID=A0A9J6G3W0_HAELO|nr:hypothetical protein HPB48_001810 [Haemaphysalis longicornis]